jgi:hypothetical protein
LFFVLDSIYDIARGGETLCIEASAIGAETQINFTDKDRQGGRFNNYIPGEKERFLADVLQGACKKISDGTGITIATEIMET